MGEIAIKVQNLSKKYLLGRNYSASLRETLSGVFSKKDKAEDFWALQDVNFEIKKGEVTGVIGKNGAGKSTLLKILSRITYPTVGKIELDGKVAALLEVGTGFHPELTGRENIFLNGSILGMGKSEIKSLFDEIVDFSGVENFLDTPVKRYSSGMYVRLAFSVAAHLRSDILLVDEVLAVGDQEFQNKCLGKMEGLSEEGRTILQVSHNLGSISKFCEKSILLEKGRVIYYGLSNQVIKNYLDKMTDNKIYNNKSSPVRSVTVNQHETSIIIDLEYNLPYSPKYPSFGVAIRDQIGNPICCLNPELSEQRITKKVWKASGKIRLTLNEINLVTGKYYISIWFSDGIQDIFKETDGLSFDVINQSFPKYYTFKNLGSVIPKSQYEYL